MLTTSLTSYIRDIKHNNDLERKPKAIEITGRYLS